MINFKPGNNWTLFLDRDGVLNHQKEGSYIFSWDEFIFYDGVIQSMPVLAKYFKHIFIVTNQRGVGKGLMTEKDLHHIHRNMQKSIELAGGRIDGIYYCTELEAESTCRKPNTGMALKAKEEHPDIDFSQSIMVGNSFSDMEFGRNIGAATVFLTTTKPVVDNNDNRMDAVYKSLADFADAPTPSSLIFSLI
ncbi:MAG: HAD-IIIA family hydrolase [Chitinophagaceae bacterium]|nr:HAD-IIIA family hydrolase [Chitinophagaceae bacterium]